MMQFGDYREAILEVVVHVDRSAMMKYPKGLHLFISKRQVNPAAAGAPLSL